MGSSGEDPNKGIDAPVGGVVWVKRQNGTWWPAEILSLDELPEGCGPTSSKAGTPIKHIGRKDARVEWYNLETSKRIKAFRCREFEWCIERAKLVPSYLLKRKSYRYAPVEDAILRALELESARLEKDHPDHSAEPDARNGEQHHVDKPSAFHSSEESEDFDKDVSQSGVPFEELSHVDSAKREPKRCRTPNDSEDNRTAGVKGKEGLADLGMGMTSSLKRKKSQVGHFHEFLTRKSPRRTLTKVLENKTPELESDASKNNKPVLINTNSDNNGVSSENGMAVNASWHANDTYFGTKQKDARKFSILETPSKESVQRFPDAPVVPKVRQSAGRTSNSSSMCFFLRRISAPTEERQYAGTFPSLSDTLPKVLTGSGARSSQSTSIETISLRHEEHSASTGSGAENVQQICDKIEKGMSTWQLKVEPLSRSRKVDNENEAETYAAVVDDDSNPISQPISDDTGSHLKSNPVTEIEVEEFRSWSRNSPQNETHTRGGSTSEMPAPQQSFPCYQSGFPVNLKYGSSDFSISHHITGSVLYDVTINVTMSSGPQHVPYISLLSKFRGEPIIGHMLTVEELEDGFCNDLLNTSELRTSSADLDFNLGTSIIHSDASLNVLSGSGARSSQSIHVETLSLRNEDHESGCNSSGAANAQQICDKIEKGTSDLQLIGEWKSRPRNVDLENEDETYATVAAEDSNHVSRSIYDETGSHLKSNPITEIQVEEFSSLSGNSPENETHMRGGSTSETPASQRTLPHQSRPAVNPKYDSSDFSISQHVTGSGLYDVTINVTTGSRPQHFPYISLLSKFHGEPIIGDPLTVKELEDGFCDDLLNTSECQTSSTNLDFNLGTSTILSDASPNVHSGSGAGSSQSVHDETVSLRNEEHELGCTGSDVASVQQVCDKIEKGMSELQLIGKWNSRSRNVDLENEVEIYAKVAAEDSNCICQSISDDTGSHLKSKPTTEIPDYQKPPMPMPEIDNRDMKEMMMQLLKAQQDLTKPLNEYRVCADAELQNQCVKVRDLEQLMGRQLAKSVVRSAGVLPSSIEINPREHCEAITPRDG